VGGIMNGQDAVTKLQAGAKLVQIYSGIVYAGPNLIGDVLSAIS
jgi:dihydroorotate dehydrogenase